MHKPFLALLFVLLLGRSAAAQSDLTLHVAVTGNDSWSGRMSQPAASDGPLRTLAAAQRAARAALAQRREDGSGAVRVVVHPGLYVLDEVLVFGPADSGAPGRPMVYQAAEPRTVTISGGRRLQPAAAPPGKEATFTAPVIDAALWAGGPQLYVNGRRAVLAREPNEGSNWFVGQPVGVPGETTNPPGHEAFKASPQALAFLQRLSPPDRARALLHVMQSWSSGRHRLAVDEPADSIRVSPRSRWPFLFFGTSQRYYVENVAAALDHAGEWIGSPGGVRYQLRPDDTQPVNAVMPLLDQLVVVRGAGLAGPYVQHLELRDLSFEHTRSLTPAAGWVDTQAAVDIGAAIQVDFARDFALRGCHIAATGGHGVWLREGVRDSTVAGCTMADLGAGGVKLGLAAQAASAANGTGANIVTGNQIRQTGRQYPGAAAVWVGQTFDNEISHNTITDTTYSGISVGWQWGYSAITSGRNSIVGNALLGIGNGVMADLGGIYTLGPAPGTVIADNLIREVHGYLDHGAGAWGIYNDEGSSDMRIENNVVIGTDSGAYHLNSGRNLVVQNNLLALGKDGEVRVSRSDPGRTRLALRNNLIVTDGQRPFTEFARAPDAEFEGNMLAPLRAGNAPDLQPCAGGCTLSSAVLVVGPGAQQIKLSGIDAAIARRWTETAANAGAVAAPAGPSSQAKRNVTIADASALSAPLAPTASQPASRAAPPLRIALDLNKADNRSRPAGWRYLPATPPDAIEPVADASAPGSRCLQFNDSPTFANRFEPYMFTRLNHMRGTSVASFAVRIDDKAEFIHEWRDEASPYLIGPSLRITPQGVEVAGKVLAPARPGSWLQLRITAQVGAASTWQLQVTDAEGKVYTATALPPKSPGWRSLQWLGFISNAAVISATCLANVDIRNDGP